MKRIYVRFVLSGLKLCSILLYTTMDGVTKVDVTFEDETVWLTQEQMAELFQKSKSTINEHIRNI